VRSLDEDLRAIRAKATALGFDAMAVARADVPLDAEMRRYEAFLEAGMHGGMHYLGEHVRVRRRLDTKHILEGARAVVCLARRYPGHAGEGKGGGPKEGDDGDTARLIARYARGRDYHNFLRKKLRQLAAYIRRLPGADGAPTQARPLCDDAPVLERAWAARAGLGFIGKNGLLIVPGQGSFALLGEVVTTLPLPPDPPIEGRCGSCTLCLDACPTSAFPQPFVLDARRCVAYLTIEHRGAIPEPLRAGVGEHLFGCDDCQTVCPFNASRRPANPSGTGPFRPSGTLRSASLLSLVSGAGDALAVLEGSPLKRAGAEGIARNAAIVLGNQRDASALPELRRAAEGHPSPVVREAASWAVQQLDGT
jgi:epoxyqueuosine reductase